MTVTLPDKFTEVFRFFSNGKLLFDKAANECWFFVCLQKFCLYIKTESTIIADD